MVYFISIQDTTADRIAFGTTNLLTLIVFQTTVTAEMPKTSDAISALSEYIMVLILVAGTGIIESVLVQKLVNIDDRTPPCWVLFLLDKVPPIIGTNVDMVKSLSITSLTKFDTNNSRERNRVSSRRFLKAARLMSWRFVAHKLDFISLVVCFLSAYAVPAFVFVQPFEMFNDDYAQCNFDL